MKILYLGSDLKIEGETKNGVFLEADEDEIKAAEQVFAEKVMIADERGIDNIIGMIAFLYPHARKSDKFNKWALRFDRKEIESGKTIFRG